MQVTPLPGHLPVWLNPRHVVSITDYGEHASISTLDGKTQLDARPAAKVFEAWQSALRNTP